MHGVSHGVNGTPPAAASIDGELASAVATTMQALATPSRVRILGRLRDGPASVGALADAVGMDPSAVSQQLRMLRQLGLVVGQRTGRQVIYNLHDDHVAALLSEAVFHTEHRRLRAAAPLAGARASSR
jgi:ArsR family transcriptional regulator, nickel/cobalt-responsive transcriptional repressor